MLNSKENLLLDRIIESKSLYNWFFNEAKDTKWFLPLKDKNYFKVNKQNLVTDSEGRVKFWVVLNYLEKVAVQVKDNKEYGKELIEFIESVVLYSKKEAVISNYHIWWFIIKIFNNIPNEIIKKEVDKEKFVFWLTEITNPDYGYEMSIHEISEITLQKFLNDPNMTDYAEILVSFLTQIKLVEGDQSSYRSKKIDFLWKSYWIEKSLDTYYKDIGENLSNSVVFEISDKLKTALEFKKEKVQIPFEIDAHYYKLVVNRIKIDGDNPVKGYLENEYQITFWKSKQENPIREDVVKEKMFIPTGMEFEIAQEKIEFKSANKEEFISFIKEYLPKNIDYSKDERAEIKISKLYEYLFEDYSDTWLKSVDEPVDRYMNDAEEILSVILKDIISAKCESKPEEAREVLLSYLSQQYRFPIFRRIAILMINKYWNKYSDLCLSIFNDIQDIFKNDAYEMELFDLLKNRFDSFTPEVIEKLKKLIEDPPEHDKEKQEKRAAYWKYKVLSPIKDKEYFKDIYLKAREVAEVKAGKDYQPVKDDITGGRIIDRTPVNKEKILEMPMDNLIEELGKFKGADTWGAMDGFPTDEGFANELQLAVKEKPEQFIAEIDKFKKTNYLYVNRIIKGARDSWKDGKEIDFQKILKFGIEYMKAEDFFEKASQGQGEDWNRKYIWFIQDIADLIEEVCKNDSRDISKEDLNLMAKFIRDSVGAIPKDDKLEVTRDAITYVFNTTLGRVIMAYMSLCLRISRKKIEGVEAWNSQFYDKIIEKGIEGIIWLGRFLPNIRYLDRNYTENKIKELNKPEVNQDIWKLFMEGYISNPNVYNELYELMYEHYKKAIERKTFNKEIDNRMIDHIILGYIGGTELLNGENNLIMLVLNTLDDKEKGERLTRFSGFFWQISPELDKANSSPEKLAELEKRKEKVKEFWDWSYKKKDELKAKVGEEHYGTFQSYNCLLAIYLDKIDEQAEKWLTEAVPYVEAHHNGTFLTETLALFEDDESVERISRIYLKMLEKATPDWQSENIVTIIENMYKLWKKNGKAEIKTNADEICNTYGRRGLHFLKELYFKYNGVSNG